MGRVSAAEFLELLAREPHEPAPERARRVGEREHGAHARVALAEPLGWDFRNDWAVPNSYPALFVLEPVVVATETTLNAVARTAS